MAVMAVAPPLYEARVEDSWPADGRGECTGTSRLSSLASCKLKGLPLDFLALTQHSEISRYSRIRAAPQSDKAWKSILSA